MADKFVSERNLEFLLYEVFNTESLTSFPYFQDHSRETFDLIISTALKLATDIMFPAFKTLDEEPPQFVNGTVKVHPVVKTYMREAGEGGWINAFLSYEHGGQQIPNAVLAACRFIFAAANYSLCVFPLLSTGAAHLITSFGSQELKDNYLEKMFSGEWQGTMALTEPQAGSSLTDITTIAEPTDNGYYKLKGQKIFISAGEHDAVENVIHLMLAKIKGAPPGIKGISLFVVPNKRSADNGQLEFNDVNCAGIYHKLGYRGAPITQLSLGEEDDCRGWLVGEPHRGLSYMFQMMNEARIDVGLGAAAIATAAYYASLAYTMERPQGRKITDKDPTKGQIPIIEHADVKRMLLYQRAIVEGALCLIIQACKYTDLIRVTDGEEKNRLELLLDLLTPIVKSYPSEMGILSISQGLQCLGGYGYCDEFPLEQYYCDCRIHPIHEGTTGIQGMDLLGRKVVMKNGQALLFFIEEVTKTIKKARDIGDLKPFAEELAQAITLLQDVTKHLTGLAIQGEIELFLADATLYLELFGIVTIAWQWLIQAIVANKALLENPVENEKVFYQGKLYTCKFFFGYELPRIAGLAKRLKTSDGLTVEMSAQHFVD